MGIKSEKTFEEIVERIVALFRPLHSSDAREFEYDADQYLDRNATRIPKQNSDATIEGNANGAGDHDVDGGSDAPAPSAASQDSPTTRRRGTPSQTEEITF